MVSYEDYNENLFDSDKVLILVVVDNGLVLDGIRKKIEFAEKS